MSVSEKKILIIVPAYNEESTISSIISNVRNLPIDLDLIIINDGSKDNTLNIARALGAKVIDLPYNLGIGGAMQTGYIYAKENNYDIAIQLDADGQHDTAYLNLLIGHILNGSCDMVIGSRYVEKTSYESSFFRRIGMVFFSKLYNVLTGNKINDTTSGYRAVNRNIIEYFASCYPTDYPEVDVLVKLHKKNFKIMEVPVEMKERQGGVSSIGSFKAVYYMVKVSLALLINTMRSGNLS